MSVTNAAVASLLKAQAAEREALITELRLMREAFAGFAPGATPKPARGNGATVKAKFADTAFGRKQIAKAAEREAAKVPCELHAAEDCNRRFSPNSRGRDEHEARILHG